MFYKPPHDLACPYCDHAFDVCRDDGLDYSEDALEHQECPSCEKTFVFTANVRIFYHPFPADCLNGGQHEMRRTKTYPPEFAVMRCKSCGHEEAIK